MAKDSNKSMNQKTKELHAKLDALGRKPSQKKRDTVSSADEVSRVSRKQKQPEKVSTAPEPIVYQRKLPRREPPPPEPSAGQGFKLPLEKAVDGVEVDSGRGKAFMVSTRVDGLKGSELLSRTFSEEMSAEDSPLCQRIASVCAPEELALEDIIFMDIETTGLNNSPLFLIGTMVWETGGLEVRQCLARNYAEEAAVIALFIETCTSKKLLITFNGKSFDIPFIRTRAITNGVPFNIEPAHFDLLHECRRIWKDVLPNCKLQTLEKRICNRLRYSDIPGDMIPEVYHEYVRTENAWLIVEVLKHNMLDIVTMADLMTRFPEP